MREEMDHSSWIHTADKVAATGRCLRTGLKVGLHQCPAEWDIHLPQPAHGAVLVHPGHIWPFVLQRTLLTPV